jgi:hypothetical protein
MSEKLKKGMCCAMSQHFDWISCDFAIFNWPSGFYQCLAMTLPPAINRFLTVNTYNVPNLSALASDNKEVMIPKLGSK